MKLFECWLPHEIGFLFVGLIFTVYGVFAGYYIEDKIIWFLLGIPMLCFAAQGAFKAKLRKIKDIKTRIRYIQRDRFGKKKELSNADIELIDRLQQELNELEYIQDDL